MSISLKERTSNLHYALDLLTRDVGDNWIENVLIDQGGTPEYDAILSTTWPDLQSKGYIQSKHHGYCYVMMPHGWIAGITRSGRIRSDEFQEKLGNIAAALKGLVKGREVPQFQFVDNVARETGVPEGFVCNVIDSRIFERCMRRRGADWEAQSGRGQLIKVPIDFGLELI